MPRILVKIIFLSILLAFPTVSGGVAWAASEGSKASGEGEHKKKKKVHLSQRRFYTLQPFTVPLLHNGEINEQFTIVISLELTDEDDRADIAYAVPRIRNDMYNELLHLVTFRRKGSTIPQIAIFKHELLKVTQRITGKKIKSLVVQQAFKGRAP